MSYYCYYYFLFVLKLHIRIKKKERGAGGRGGSDSFPVGDAVIIYRMAGFVFRLLLLFISIHVSYSCISCIEYSALISFFFSVLCRSTRVFLSWGSYSASCLHLLQHVPICSGMLKNAPLFSIGN